MKKIFIVLSLFCMMSCASNNSSNNNSQEESDSTTIEVSDDNLDFLKDIAKKVTPEIDYGIQTLALDYLDKLGFAKLEEILGCKLYLKGPHNPQTGWETYADEQGYYNPEAVKKLSSLVDQILEDKDFVNATKPIVDKYMSNRLMILVGMYQAIQLGGEFDPYILRFPINESKDVAYSGIDYVYDCAYTFWNRRKTDGTDKLFYNIVLKIFKTYFGYETIIDKNNIDEYIQLYDDYIDEGEYEGEYEGVDPTIPHGIFAFVNKFDGSYSCPDEYIEGAFTRTKGSNSRVNFYYSVDHEKLDSLVNYNERDYKYEGLSLKQNRTELYLNSGDKNYTFGIIKEANQVIRYQQIEDAKGDKSLYYIDGKEVKKKKYEELVSKFADLKEYSENMTWYYGGL